MTDEGWMFHPRTGERYPDEFIREFEPALKKRWKEKEYKRKRAGVHWLDREVVARLWMGICAYCGADVGNIAGITEHVILTSRGGSNDLSNLVLSCFPCNCEKASRTAAEYGHPEVEAKALAIVEKIRRYWLGDQEVRDWLDELGILALCDTPGYSLKTSRVFGPKTLGLEE